MGLKEFSTDSAPENMLSGSVLPALKEYAKEYPDQKWLNAKRLTKQLPYSQRKVTYYLQRSEEFGRWSGEC